MSAIDSTSAGMLGGAGGDSAAVRGLTTDEFLEIVLQELQSQDPLEPNDTSAMLEQLSTIWSIQSDSDMMDRLERVVSQSELASASGLVGRIVGGLNEFGDRVSGIVRAVSVTDSGPVLRLESGDRVAMAQIDEFLTPAPADDAGDDGDDRGDDS